VGEVVLRTEAETSSSTISNVELIAFRVPGETVIQLVPDIDDRLARRISRDTPRCGC